MAWQTLDTATALVTSAAAAFNKLVNNLNLSFGNIAAAKGDLCVASGAKALAVLTVGTDTSSLVADSTATNGIKWLLPAAVRANRTTTQTISGSTETAIAFNAADDYDTNSMHDVSTANTHLIAPTKGVYHTTGHVTFGASATGTQRYLKIRKNGSGTWEQTGFPLVPGALAANFEINSDVLLLATHYVELMVYSDGTGAGLNITGATFSMTLVAPL